MFKANPDEYDFEDELGAISASARVSTKRKKKKKKRKIGRRFKKAFKKIGKAAAIIGTGGLAAPALIKKSKLKKMGKKFGKAMAVIGTGGLAAAPMLRKRKLGKKIAGKVRKAKGLFKPKKLKKTKPTAKRKTAPRARPRATLPPIARAVQKVSASDCKNKDEMARIVAAKLMVTLGKPLSNANKILAKQELQNQATYEHKKLMSDADFRRKVLGLLTRKAANGNKTCERTIRVIMAR